MNKKITQPVVVLVRPQMYENIGLAARAMGNFGASKLRLVSPRDSWPSQIAVASSTNAIGEIVEVELYSQLEEALFDIEFSFATSIRKRFLNKSAIKSKDLVKSLKDNYINYNNPNGKWAIIFGPENNGLSNKDLAFADLILNIITQDNFSSLNLAQAVAICLYQLSLEKESAYENKMEQISSNHLKAAKLEDLVFFLKRLEQKLDGANFFSVPEKKPQMMVNITNLFKRIQNLSKQDVKTLNGILSSLDGK